MKAIMKDGSIQGIDTKFMFDNQYNTVDGKRIYDTSIKQIIDDIRLGEFYCCSKKQGTYDEVEHAIIDERAKINQCKDCFWHHQHNRIESECHKDRIENGNTLTISETTVYEVSCAYIPEYNTKCVHDIDEKPRLFREVQNCFFCKHPEGVPDMSDFRHFLIDNARKYDIVPRWGDQILNHDSSFAYKKKFGSYKLEGLQSQYFELSNARNRFLFLINFADKSFILDDGIGYKEVKRFEVSEWNYEKQKSVSMPIKNWDKFTAWLFPIIDDYNASKEAN